ncbi:SUMF1/EgtB/PvdO family nonheme iron enzyme [Hyphococcus sp. DH-69]|uniref:SUMF1/EgtB/PvdO family nonheme iron enzyme n=1 Tax=Hyphococcus formosus TaxID=3143534 RepID=UPI00398A857F
MSAVSIIHAPRDEALGEKIATALSHAGHATKRVFADNDIGTDQSSESESAAIVLWTHAAAKLAKLHQQAFDAMARGALIPVAVNGASPPGGFEALPPVDLSGWSGATDDPRFRFILEEIQLAHSRMKLQDGMVWREPETEPVEDTAFTEPDITPDQDPIEFEQAPIYPEAGQPYTDEMDALPPFLAQKREPIRFKARDVAFGGTAALVLMAAATAVLVPIILPVPSSDRLVQETIAEPRQVDTTPDPSPITPSNLASVTISEPPLDVPALPMVSANDAIAEDREIASDPITETEVSTEPTENIADDTDEMEMLVASASAESVGEASDVTPLPAVITDAAFTGNYFKECVDCPDMAVIPAGRFLMGATDKSEGPLLEVAIARDFALSSREVTFAQWDACVADGGCKAYRAPDHGWGRDKHPVVSVSFEDAQAYTAWLSNKTGRNYRLPSEAEWEYAARGGTTRPFGFEGTLTIAKANFNGNFPYGAEKETFRKRTVPVASFAPNPYGLFDMHGNVWEWTSDCWSASHTGGMPDGSPRGNGDCDRRVLKGGAWNTGGWRLRAGHRIAKAKTTREYDNGFRVARDLH